MAVEVLRTSVPVYRTYPTLSVDSFFLEQLETTSISVVILAKDEASILGETLQRLRPALGSADEVHVVADHCVDDTAMVAWKHGAEVHIRCDGGKAGKGAALRWWLERTHEDASPDQVIVVLDADSQVALNFFDRIRERFDAGELVIQTRVEPLVLSETPISKLAAYSEFIEQRVNDGFRSNLGWPVRLRGTGMAFRRYVLERVAGALHTYVEDAELSILLGVEGYPITFVPETYVADPKPNDQVGAVRQRARWLKGQAQVLRSYPKQIFQLIRRGLPGLSLLSSVLLKPRTLLLSLKAGFVGMLWMLALTLQSPGWWVFASLGAANILFDVGIYFYGLRYVSNKRETLKVLVLVPLYLIMWIRSLALSTLSGNGWLRSRPKFTTEPSVASARPAEVVVYSSQ